MKLAINNTIKQTRSTIKSDKVNGININSVNDTNNNDTQAIVIILINITKLKSRCTT